MFYNYAHTTYVTLGHHHAYLITHISHQGKIKIWNVTTYLTRKYLSEQSSRANTWANKKWQDIQTYQKGKSAHVSYTLSLSMDLEKLFVFWECFCNSFNQAVWKRLGLQSRTFLHQGNNHLLYVHIIQRACVYSRGKWSRNYPHMFKVKKKKIGVTDEGTYPIQCLGFLRQCLLPR